MKILGKFSNVVTPPSEEACARMKFPKEKGKIANPSASSSRLLAQKLRVLPKNGGFYDASEEKLTPHLTTWWFKTFERDRS